MNLIIERWQDISDVIYISTMISLEHEIDFTKDKTEQPELEPFLKQAIKLIEKEESELLAKFKKPIFDQDLENHLIVTNIPDATGKQEKFEKLFKEKLLEKKKIGPSHGLESIQFGYKMDGDSKKCNNTLYLIYKTAAIAKKAYQKLHLFKFDKEHQLLCFTVKQFRLVEKLPENFQEPKIFQKVQCIQHNIDENLRDQFLYRLSGSDSERLYLKWFDHVQKSATDAIKREEDQCINLQERIKNIVSSPRGTYVAVCTNQGVRLFVGSNLQFKAFYPHKGVCEVAFSPNQNYMITFTGVDNLAKAYESLILWGVKQEVNLYSIRSGSFHDLSSFQFNATDTKLAIIGENQVSIHNCDSFAMLKDNLKTSEDDLIESGRLIKALDIKKVMWMPDGKNILCICYELNPSPQVHSTTRIYFHNIQTREQRKWRAVGQHIKKVEVTLSDYNDWVAVSFKKIHKKTQTSTSVFIVDLNKRELETDVIDFKENVVSISWDKKNGKFGAVYELNTGVRSVHTQFGVYFYQIQRKNNIQQATKICEIKQTPLNRLIMAQNGTYFALYNTSPESSGRDKYSLGFISKDQKKKYQAQLFKENTQVSYMTFFFMEQSGRFVILGTDKMFQIWNMAGQLVFKNNETMDIRNVQFRPRYITQISKEEEKKLADAEKQLKAKYSEIDFKRTNQIEYENQQKKLKKRQNFKAFLQQKREWYNTFKDKMVAIRGFDQNAVRTAEYSYWQLDRN